VEPRVTERERELSPRPEQAAYGAERRGEIWLMLERHHGNREIELGTELA